ncbi:MAG: hypothetical protein ACXWUG_17400 [Polyangiales bacterium]
MLTYSAYDLAKSAEDARRMDRMSNIYHRGQDLAWNGREVLAELVEKHGGTHVPEDLKAPLREVFGSILWGELAAWRISAQLADRIEPLGAKMAATSQAHDEARHFYVIHDYLVLATGSAPGKLGKSGERLLNAVLGADDLACKILGMQLQVETTALTIFQSVRQQRVCPVLSDLLLYFEKDEARHVGLGLQYLPMLVRQMSPLQQARFTAYALEITVHLLATQWAMTPALRAIGIDPRETMRLGKSKQLLVFEELWANTPGGRSATGEKLSLVLEALANATWPDEHERDLRGRIRSFVRALRTDGVAPVPTAIDPS